MIKRENKYFSYDSIFERVFLDNKLYFSKVY